MYCYVITSNEEVLGCSRICLTWEECTHGLQTPFGGHISTLIYALVRHLGRILLLVLTLIFFVRVKVCELELTIKGGKGGKDGRGERSE